VLNAFNVTVSDAAECHEASASSSSSVRLKARIAKADNRQRSAPILRVRCQVTALVTPKDPEKLTVLNADAMR
jgi:hypothetical protein